jgi:alpha-1,3-rhamnosyl/mannosyltransferase
VTDDDLPAVYSGAAVTVQPSLYEGFGLPVLEAMACGSPVCASRASSLPEVGGEAARYFAPEEADQITDVLRAVLSDEPLREAMRAAGIARAAELSWAKTAQQTVALYERTIESAQS